MPNRARGELWCLFKNGVGHSMAWEIIDNEPVIFDAQRRWMSDRASDDVDWFHVVADNMESAGILRLDNKELNFDFLRKWVKSF